MPPPTSPPADSPPRAAARRLGPYQLVRLLGKSERSMSWQAVDGRSGQDMVLALPRVQPADADAMERWLQRVRRAARLDHPQLAPAAEISVIDGWPFVAYELGELATWSDRIGNQGQAAQDAAGVTVSLVQALAFVHDAGLVHRDLQAFHVLVSDRGAVRLAATEVGGADDEAARQAPHAIDPATLHVQRNAAALDVLQAGLLLHHALTGQPPLGDADAAKVARMLPPLGRELIRLPWSTPRPIPEPLRVIVNRASDRQERQRYRNARTLARAIEGWLQVEQSSHGGPLALLLDRLRSVGVLPATPGAAERAARLALLEREHTSELAETVLDDTALAFELLRTVNTAQVRGGQVSGNGPVLTVRRAIAMLGLEGVRRVALALRTWPGPLSAAQAVDLERLLDRCRRAGRVAVAIRPAGYDGEVVYLVTQLQNLGRLVVQYHFADEATQIGRLMQPAPSDDGRSEEPGMAESTAAMAVLGVDLEAISTAVARWWGMDDSVLGLMRRMPGGSHIHALDSDDETIRAVASCANEAVDASALPARRQLHALQAVAQRYGRVLGIGLQELQQALQAPAGAPLGGVADAAAWPVPRAARPETAGPVAR